MCDFIKSCLGKRSFKGQGRLMGFNVTEYEKLMCMASDSTLQLTYKKLPPVAFGVVPENISSHLKRLLKYFLFKYILCEFGLFSYT